MIDQTLPRNEIRQITPDFKIRIRRTKTRESCYVVGKLSNRPTHFTSIAQGEEECHIRQGLMDKIRKPKKPITESDDGYYLEDCVVDMALLHFRKNPRCVDDKGQARYFYKGVVDIVGLFLKNPEKWADRTKRPSHYEDLQDEVKHSFWGLPSMFWDELQAFHDADENWKKFVTRPGHGLTEQGKKALAVLRERWA